MTQPPDQPSPDGFGPPQPQPGYGYPQQPQPGHPPQTGPYGRPGPYPQQGPYAQAGPYAQPGPYTAPQPGYGSPQQYPQVAGMSGAPGAPTPPPGGQRSRNPFKGRPVLVVGAAVAALLVIAGTVYAVGGGGHKKPTAQASHAPAPSATTSAPVDEGDGNGDGGQDDRDLNAGRRPGESKVLWYKEAPKAPGSGAYAPGMWITGRTAVKAAYNQVLAYRVGDGAPAWAPITLPQKICAVTPEKAAGDRIVVAYMSGVSDRAKCDQLQEIDLDSGRTNWSMQVPDGDGFDSASEISLSASGNVVLVGRESSGIAYDIRTRKKLWDVKGTSASCMPSGFAGGPRLVSILSCYKGGTRDHDEVRELEPVHGRPRWTTPLAHGLHVEHVYSVDPLVLQLTDESFVKRVVVTLKSGGAPRSTITESAGARLSPDCSSAQFGNDLRECTDAVADANTLYLPTSAQTGSANQIVALDLDTGKERWRVKSPVSEPMQPIKAAGTGLIAYVAPSSDAGGRVLSVATGGSHTMTTLLRNPASVAEIETFPSRAIDYVDGRFYVSTTELAGRTQTNAKLMLAYGK
ncbi:PQQ-binding-like beta-propeller repeat protein [Streptomyces sp. NPDC048664]|uniref:outer membrane protein assembly factor BamB family protein n=1 Tax=Streptomyces sp. NPDC048664 TaxID=3154505 RepID=UPI00341C06D8